MLLCRYRQITTIQRSDRGKSPNVRLLRRRLVRIPNVGSKFEKRGRSAGEIKDREAGSRQKITGRESGNGCRRSSQRRSGEREENRGKISSRDIGESNDRSKETERGKDV